MVQKVEQMKAGAVVEIRPQSFPLQVWQGVVQRRCRHGFSVAYRAFGMKCRDVFHINELEVVA